MAPLWALSGSARGTGQGSGLPGARPPRPERRRTDGSRRHGGSNATDRRSSRTSAHHVGEACLDRFGRITGLLLDQAHHAVPLAFGPIELVVGENAPRLLDPAAHLIPLALELELPPV